MVEIRDTWEGAEVWAKPTNPELRDTWEGAEVWYLLAAPNPPQLRDTWEGAEVWYLKTTVTETPVLVCGVASAFKGGVRRAQGVCE